MRIVEILPGVVPAKPLPKPIYYRNVYVKMMPSGPYVYLGASTHASENEARSIGEEEVRDKAAGSLIAILALEN